MGLIMVARGRGGYSRKFYTGPRLCLFTAEMTEFPTRFKYRQLLIIQTERESSSYWEFEENNGK